MKNKIFKTIWWRIKSVFAMCWYGNPAKKMKIVGVTGTNGKTTTATLLYKVATELGLKAGLVSTVENIILKERKGATHTTPDSITLTKLFKEMADAGCEYVFMEVSSHAIHQNRVWGIEFTGGIFTNLTHDHLDYHKNLENYFLAKKKFFDKLGDCAFALSNVDDSRGRLILEHTKANKFFYGFNKDMEEVNFKGEILKIGFSGLELKFNDTLVKSQLLGKFNAHNLLSVWSASSLLGFDMEKVTKILETISPPSGRFQHFTSPAGALIIVDYAHTPDALEKVLLTARDVKEEGGKLISLVGCGGDRDPMKRPVMGKLGASMSDIAIFTSDNPRSEDPNKILEEMQKNLSSELLAKVKVIPERQTAIREAVKIAKKGDVVLCAGKGHEDYQEIKGVKYHFDDVEEFQKAFGKDL